MFAYKTNSSDYLDYVAASLTREEILNDPDLCFLLENPYIKDNMEVALAWNAAKFGDYEDKYNFVEYYLCNGPELDADTLLHYRALAQADPVVMEIAYSYFSDVSVLSDIRETKYGKKKNGDWTDCFKNPCFYLGDFSGVMGSMGDNKNVDTYFNVLSEQWNATFNKKELIKKKQEELIKQGREKEAAEVGDNFSSDSSALKLSVAGNKILKPNVEGFDTTKGRAGTSPSSDHLSSKIRPEYSKGWATIGQNIFRNDVAFAQDCAKVTKWSCPLKFGDWMGRSVAQQVDLLDKANVARMLGDCFRMWTQVRNLRVFGSDNQYGPITSDQLVKNRMADGTTRFCFKNSHPTPADATHGINPGILEQAKRAIASGLFESHTNTPQTSVTNPPTS